MLANNLCIIIIDMNHMIYLDFSKAFDKVLYCIMRPCTDGRLDRYHIGIPRELSEIRTQPWLSEGSLTCDPCHHRGPIF